ncbi:unnamed protein product [Psylliodes chrysocephalus]|uniref:Tesmin/TSO1-like CXC domain-containing protein n=1 Tax=Psylliodes chrysocephalus TaxID=3402493 RepID=A0A9P0CY61_9CUCU|nr:unnamed protein product [Psylliodes chrysocephala]
MGLEEEQKWSCSFDCTSRSCSRSSSSTNFLTKGCQGTCGCRKVGLSCSLICSNCDNKCNNMPQVLEDSDKKEDSDTILEPLLNEIDSETIEKFTADAESTDLLRQ